MKPKPVAEPRQPNAPHRVLYARWIDAHALVDSWCPIADIDDLAPRNIETVGFHIDGLKPGHLVLAQSADADIASVDHVIAIPVAMLRQVVDLTMGVEYDLSKLR